MRVCFICSSLEPGKHGIGDYTRMLVVKLLQEGQEVCVLALSDPFIYSEYKGVEEQSGVLVPMLRIPANWPVRKRAILARTWIEQTDPDWLSFQSCLFSYSHKGLPLGLTSLLTRIGEGRRWHIMFHELWLGEVQSDPLKNKILGFFQKMLVRHLIVNLNPEAVFTSNSFYQACLEKIGVKAKLVPIFSNIPLGKNNHLALFKRLPTEVLENRQRYVIGTFFGSIKDCPELITKVLQLKELIQKSNKKLLITHLGRSEGVVERFRVWQEKYNIQTYSFGECEEQEIADYMQQIDFGLSTYPKALLEKSGSIAALNLNGLPVILLRNRIWEDERQFNWVKEVDEIMHIEDFLVQKSTGEPYFEIGHTVQNYLATFIASTFKQFAT